MRAVPVMLILVIVMSLLVVPVGLAQDDEPIPPTQEVAEEEPSPEPNEETGGGFDVVDFLSGALIGSITALGAVFGIVGRLKNDKAALDAIEWLGRSVPVDALDKINEFGRNLRDAGEVIDKVTDGLPNEPEAVG